MSRLGSVDSFKLIPFATERREVIRWFMKDYEHPTDNILKVLRFALEDTDWEVRVSAMIAICKYKLADFLPSVRKCELPTTTSSGLTKPLLRSLITIKKVIISYLVNGELPEDPGKDLSSNLHFAHYCLRIILGQKVSIANDYFLLLTSLIQPISPKLPLDKMPSCLQTVNGDIILKGTQIEMIYVPNYGHWIGSDTGENNPIKLVKPKSGFFISRDPLRGPNASPYSNEYVLKSFDGALRYLKAIEGICNHKLGMPNNLATEMAIRGHNGRLYPWGNSLNKDEIFLSPWGVNQPLGTVEYWSSSTPDAEHAFTFGSSEHRFCSQRVIKSRSDLCTMRIIVD